MYIQLRKTQSVILVLSFILFSCKKTTTDPAISPEPTISITAPIAETIVDKAFSVLVNAEAVNGIKKVDLYINNIFTGSASSSPYIFTVNIDGYASGNYTIRAVAISNSDKQAIKETKVTITKASLEKPLDFKASRGTYGNKIALSWNKVTSATGYQVYKLNNTTKEYALLATVTNNTYEDLALDAPLTQCFYKVKAYNSQTVYGDFCEADYGYSNGKAYDMVGSFGTEGRNPDQFGMIIHLSYYNNELYLADDYEGRVVRYSITGQYLGVFQTYVAPKGVYFFGDSFLNISGSVITIQKGSTILKTIDAGSTLGIRQVTTDDQNFIYAAGSNSNLVVKYDMQGNKITQWGVKGGLPGQFDGAWGIAYYNDQIVVTNYSSKKVQFFSKTGQFIKEWNFDDAAMGGDICVKNGFLYIAMGNYIVKTDYSGAVIEKIYGAFTFATGVVVDDNNNVIVTDPYQRKIYVYKKN